LALEGRCRGWGVVTWVGLRSAPPFVFRRVAVGTGTEIVWRPRWCCASAHGLSLALHAIGRLARWAMPRRAVGNWRELDCRCPKIREAVVALAWRRKGCRSAELRRFWMRDGRARSCARSRGSPLGGDCAGRPCATGERGAVRARAARRSARADRAAAETGLPLDGFVPRLLASSRGSGLRSAPPLVFHALSRRARVPRLTGGLALPRERAQLLARPSRDRAADAVRDRVSAEGAEAWLALDAGLLGVSAWIS